ncbi:hypothetical protein GRI40_06360 [Altererythrobacter aerius]|uniref:Uncharacterized protein n=1 Tax=Tsuneonella aeria TaxID=1837929 RepID=A0A6I4TC62_9SPHN|nr:hypothetical protein [Tsuneonella aeria]MXO74842.1 hypothetical protein [Tsuneonella aeria]
MISDWELWACANAYVNRHQEDAPAIAAMRCDELLEEGDIAGVRTFQAIIERIHKLLQRSAAGESVH